MSAQPPAHLADVNVLMALLWPRHVHHAAAHAWFAGQGHLGWATNTITQMGAVRLLTNHSVTQGAVDATAALRTLAEAARHVNHRFWELERPAAEMLTGHATLLTGHRQWTDLLLLRHAAEKRGVLVTFDSGIAALAGKESQRHLLVLG